MTIQKYDIHDEAQLLLLVKDDKEPAFEVVFKRYYPSLVLYAKRFIIDHDMAESIVQSVFVKLWDSRKALEIQSLKGFLLVSVRNACFNELKHSAVVEKHKSKVQASEPIDWPLYEETIYLTQINQVIDRLPPQRRRIFNLSRIDGLKYREIALELNISSKTVEVQMGLALKFLREKLLPLRNHILGAPK